MEIRISVDEYADVPFIKKLLSQIKGVKNVEITEDNKTYSWEEIESSDEFKQLIEQSRNQIKNGEYEEFSDELIDSILIKNENSFFKGSY